MNISHNRNALTPMRAISTTHPITAGQGFLWSDILLGPEHLRQLLRVVGVEWTGKEGVDIERRKVVLAKWVKIAEDTTKKSVEKDRKSRGFG